MSHTEIVILAVAVIANMWAFFLSRDLEKVRAEMEELRRPPASRATEAMPL